MQLSCHTLESDNAMRPRPTRPNTVTSVSSPSTLQQVFPLRLAGSLLLLLSVLVGCSDSTAEQESFHGENAFPAAGDLALLVPRDDAQIRALDVFSQDWLDAVDEALAKSELDESIALENHPDDWRLVSGRFVTCSPLGKVADPQEIDALC